MTAQQVLEQHQEQLMSIPDVVGVGLGGSEAHPEIIIMVRQHRTEMATTLPKQLNGYPVRVEVSGEINAF
jgi:hypothetical protein